MCTQRKWATKICEESLQLDTACCRSRCCFATGTSDHDTRTALAFFSFAAQALPTYTSRYSSSVPTGNDHARFGLRTMYRTTRRARAGVLHVARVDFSLEVLDRVLHVRSARCPNTPTRLRNQDFCSSLTGSSLWGFFRSRACYTFRPLHGPSHTCGWLVRLEPDQQTT